MIITQILAVIGAIVGTAGLVLGILNHLRDAPDVRVILIWDMEVHGDIRYSPNDRFGLVKVANTGRRPIYISTASITLPKGYAHTHLVLSEGIQGDRLAEGDPPKVYRVNQRGMEQYAKEWRKIRAVVFDSANREYISPRPHRKAEPPSWARTN